MICGAYFIWEGEPDISHFLVIFLNVHVNFLTPTALNHHNGCQLEPEMRIVRALVILGTTRI